MKARLHVHGSRQDGQSGGGLVTPDMDLAGFQTHALQLALDGLPVARLAEGCAAFIEMNHPGCSSLIELMPQHGQIFSPCGQIAGTPFAPWLRSGSEILSPQDACLQRNRTIAVSDFNTDPDWAAHGLRAVQYGYTGCVCVPVPTRSSTAVAGTISVYSRPGHIVDPALAKSIERLAGFLGQLLVVSASSVDEEKAKDSFAELASTIPGVVYQRVVKPDGDIRYTYMSEGAKELFGVDAKTVVSDPEALFQHYGPSYRSNFKKRLMDASKELKLWDVEATINRPDGETRYTHAIAKPRLQNDGSVVWTGVILDATRMKLAELAAAATEAKTREAIVESLSQGILLFDANDRLIITNSHFFTLHPGLEDIAVPGASYVDVLTAELHPDRNTHVLRSDMTSEFAERFVRHGNHDHTMVERRIGPEKWILVNEHCTPDGGTVVLYTDVSDLKQRERRIEHLAHHDALTGLANRTLFRKKLEEALTAAEIDGTTVAVMCLDLDRFKGINDTLGHPTGDVLLQTVAKRLEKALRECDTAARLGGDEFALILPGLADSELATSLAWRLINVMSKPVSINGHVVVTGTSIGISLANPKDANADDLLKNADLALYRAKSDGRGTFRFFEEEMDAIAQERRLLELDLRAAIASDGLTVAYQPLVDVFTAQMVGVEALVRWDHPTRGNVPPVNFIPLAEETGLISQIGAWVLRRACEDAVTWPRDIRVAVNVSPAQFRSGKFAEQVQDTLEQTGLPPARLEIEITESLLLRDTQANLATLHRIKALGVRVSMDDFGTGYSSLGNLRSFPFDKIKIDKSFINDMKNSADAAAIVRSVVTLGRSLGMTTTAEGVETRDQLVHLRSEGCSEVQGFYYSEACGSSMIASILNSSLNGIMEPK
jgi:diguanylate cyclase (GGDEF)-like protein